MTKQNLTGLLFVILTISASVTAQSQNSALDLLKRGNAALAGGDWATAVKNFTLAIQNNSRKPNVTITSEQINLEDCIEIVTSDDFNACALSNRGIANYQLGNLEESIADFDRALRINPRLADVYSNRGNVWQARGNLDKALLDFNQAIKLNPRHNRAFNNRANLWLSKGILKEAINDYTRSIELDSTNATVFANRGLTYLRLRQNKEARLDFDLVEKLDPTLKKKLEELINQERNINPAMQ